jgi:Flp pilus assembly protein TadG
MNGHFRAKLGRFARNSEGATLIEFAMVFPVMLLMTFGIMELSLYMFSQVTLEAGLKEASRYGITSRSDVLDPDLADQVPVKFRTGNPREEMIGFILNQFTSDLIDLDEAVPNTKTYNSFMLIKDGEPYDDVNGNGQYDLGETFQDIACPTNGTRDGPASTGESVGAAGAIVVYTVTYNWRVMTPFVGPYLGTSDGQGGHTIPMRASMVAKNEPAVSGSTFGC